MAEKTKNPLEFTAERITEACGVKISADDLEYNGYEQEKGTFWSALVKPANSSKHYAMIAVYWHEKGDEVISWSAHSVK